jgi:hypothetical protein
MTTTMVMLEAEVAAVVLRIGILTCRHLLLYQLGSAVETTVAAATAAVLATRHQY